jgi:DNA modification methylase
MAEQSVGASKIDRLSVEKLIPYAKNSRTHSAEQVAQIAASIKEFGFNNPVLIDEDNGIIAGHGRVLAAQKLGLQAVPCIRLAHLSDTQRKAYVIADNRLALNAGWDDSMLMLELQELKAEDFNLDLLGFEAEELNALLNPIKETEGLTDEDAVPEVPEEPKTKPGDIYQLGRHRLMCGDSTSIDAVEKLMDGQLADMVITDPPYGIGYEYADHKDDNNEANAQLVWDVFALHQCGKVWTPGLMNLARDIERFGKTRVAVWHKKFAAAGNGVGGASTWEPILIVEPQEKKLKNDVIVLKTDREEVGGKSLRDLHSCPKPVGLYEELINSFVKERGIVFEPFCGSGTTLIAAEKSARICYGMEMSPKYCDVIVKRWEEFTGQKANLAEL